MAIYTMTRRKSAESVDPRARVIDDLQRISNEARSKFLGTDWFRTVRVLYNLVQSSAARPSFRPAVGIPQLQLLNFNEATDLASLSPKVYITNQKRERIDEREHAFQDHWRWQNVNNRLLFAELWALYCGTTFLQVGWDPTANMGDGEVWTDWLDPENVFPDPYAKSGKDLTFYLVETRMYPDMVAHYWPETGRGITPVRRVGSPNINMIGDAAGYNFEMPPGPLSAMPGMGAQTRPPTDGRVKVRFVWCLDYSVREVQESKTEKVLKSLQEASTKTIRPRYKPMFPNGHYMVECEGRILVDADNPFPVTSTSKFPIIELHALPNLTSFWAPPPPRFSIDLQQLAERMMSQTFENAVRLNNGVWFIDESTGIDAEDFGGLPGEVRIINPNSKVPEIKWPTAMPDHMTKMPLMLLQLQKELQGFSQTREGQSSKGNVSAGLFDASLYQSQFLTRLRSMLLAETVQKLAEMQFATMCRYYKHSRYFPSFAAKSDEESEFSFSEWKPLDMDADAHQLHVDPGSVRPISQAALRNLVMQLRSAGLISVADALNALEIPDADAKAAEVEQENQLAALAKVKKR